MTYTSEEIIRLNMPYEQLGNADAFAEHIEVLNSLTDKEKVSLATKIILACPEKEFKRFFYQIQALKNPMNPQGSFHTVITDAYQARSRIYGLLDERNLNPHFLLLGKEFKPELFHRFSELSQQIIEPYGVPIAERLALFTPKQDQDQLIQNIESAFPESTPARYTKIAFDLRQDVEQILLGDNPEQYFIFEAKTFHESSDQECLNLTYTSLFSKMFHHLLNGHEQEIGLKLSALPMQETKIKILDQLHLLDSLAAIQPSPFKLIAETMNPPQINSFEHATNPNTLFSSPPPSIEENEKHIPCSKKSF